MRAGQYEPIVDIDEVARMIGAAIGRPDLPYVQIPENDLRAALEAAGWSPDATRLQVEMNRVFSDGSVAGRATSTAASTTPTRFEDHAAADLAPRSPRSRWTTSNR